MPASSGSEQLDWQTGAGEEDGGWLAVGVAPLAGPPGVVATPRPDEPAGAGGTMLDVNTALVQLALGGEDLAVDEPVGAWRRGLARASWS